MIRKGSLDFRRTYQSIDDLYTYQKEIVQFYFNESGNDMFDFYTSLYYKLAQDNDVAPGVLSAINRMIQQIKESSAVDPQLLAKRIQSFQSNVTLLNNNNNTVKEETSEEDSAILSELTGSLDTILEFAGPSFEKSRFLPQTYCCL